MSFIEELRATVTRAKGETELLQIALSESVEKVDELIQLYATDLQDTANDDAIAFSTNINLARQNLQATIAALDEAETHVTNYLNYIG